MMHVFWVEHYLVIKFLTVTIIPFIYVFLAILSRVLLLGSSSGLYLPTKFEVTIAIGTQ
jgi:hypothetical protein